MRALIDSIQMAGLAFVSVALWTLRVALTARGRRVAGSITAGLEAIVFVLAFSRVAADLEAIERILGYSIGVAMGTFVGVVLDEALSAGQSELRIVTEGRHLSHVLALQREGWPVTWVPGQGPNGDVTVAFVAVDDKRVAGLVQTLKQSAPDGFVTVERLRSARAGRVDADWVQVGQVRALDLVRRHPTRQTA
jgi:uncharacterized protein YebE (UPF0316 family)